MNLQNTLTMMRRSRTQPGKNKPGDTLSSGLVASARIRLTTSLQQLLNSAEQKPAFPKTIMRP